LAEALTDFGKSLAEDEQAEDRQYDQFLPADRSKKRECQGIHGLNSSVGPPIRPARCLSYPPSDEPFYQIDKIISGISRIGPSMFATIHGNVRTARQGRDCASDDLVWAYGV